MKFGKMIMTTLLIFATSTISAMSNAVPDSLTEEETSAIRQQIGLDLSMPDFKTIHFVDGVSDSPSANDLFCYLSRYVRADANAHPSQR